MPLLGAFGRNPPLVPAMGTPCTREAAVQGLLIVPRAALGRYLGPHTQPGITVSRPGTPWCEPQAGVCALSWVHLVDIPAGRMHDHALVRGELGALCARGLLSSPILASRVVHEETYNPASCGPLSKICC